MKKDATENTLDDRFELLKKLLLASEQEELASLKQEVLEHEKFKQRVDPIIDEKIMDLRNRFPEYFGDTITQTIKTQIRDSQDEVVEALYPIMGKLVKKFIVAEVAKLSESINETIKSKFSFLQILKRTFNGKKSNAKEVLEEVFEPIIEEVFIIEKNSGLLIGNYSRGNIADKDMVSGMLTAIKSFSEEAFAREGQDLEDIRFETFQLSLLNFKTIYIATATSGVLSTDFKEDLTEKLHNLAEKILVKRRLLKDPTRINQLIKSELIESEKDSLK